MIGEMRQGMFITIVFGVVDPGQNSIVFARAGHELPLVGSDDDSGQFTTEYLESEGMPVGMVESELFDLVLEDRTVVTRPGDLFVLYTDGVTEAPNPEGKEFSGARLADAVKTLRIRSAPELISGILENVARFSGRADYPDDISLIAIKRIDG
jgi:sigma-B regulation protein RsbU (phosphoserine phosphatase)